MVFVPLERHPRLRANPNLRDDRTVDWLHIHGRLNAGVDFTRANALVSATVAGLAQRYPQTNQYKSATVEPYASLGAAQIPESRRILSVMLGLAGAVLLVVCLNISGMMLVRGTTRERELSIRSALGAARQRLIQHLFFEALWLAVLAAAISGFVLFGIPAIAGWYLAIVHGVPRPAAGVIRDPLGRDPEDRRRVAPDHPLAGIRLSELHAEVLDLLQHAASKRSLRDARVSSGSFPPS
jgi:hypothetical protein